MQPADCIIMTERKDAVDFLATRDKIVEAIDAAYARGLADGRQLGEDEARIAYDLFLGRSRCRVIDGLPPSTGRLATMPGEMLDEKGAIHDMTAAEAAKEAKQ